MEICKDYKRIQKNTWRKGLDQSRIKYGEERILGIVKDSKKRIRIPQ